jgi:hypothetical protein
MMSPWAKLLPGGTSQRAIVPSVIVRPSFGMTKSVVVMGYRRSDWWNMISSENRLPLFGIMLDQRPAKVALRFSRNALQPSWESLVSNTSPIMLCS